MPIGYKIALFLMIASFIIILLLFILLLSKAPRRITYDTVEVYNMVALIKALDDDILKEEQYQSVVEKYTPEKEDSDSTYGMMKEVLDILDPTGALSARILDNTSMEKKIPKDEFYNIYENLIDEYGKRDEIALEEVKILGFARNITGNILVTDSESGTCALELFTEYQGYVTDTYVKRNGQGTQYVAIKDVKDESMEAPYLYVTGVDSAGVHFWINGFEVILPYDNQLVFQNDTICSLTIKEGQITHTESFQKKINDKVLSINDRSVTLESLGNYEFTESMRIYKVFDGLSKGSLADVALGYEFVDFVLKDKEDKLTVYTTRPDTLFGVTYMVMSPEHPFIDKYKADIKNWDDVIAYRELASKKSDFERTELAKDKTGVMLDGLTAINPVNGKEIPVWISDYVLMTYGTGAIMAVPAHDERDWEFAKKFNMPIIEVVAGSPVDVNEAVFTDVATGTLVNSDFLNGLSVAEAKQKITEFLTEKNIGHAKTNFKLRDWVFSRQRYWGEPIPVVKCDKCGYVALPESELPLELPEVESYMPTDNGESPLAHMTDWVKTTCPCCGGPALRETDTMPQWAGSSWYFLRYTDPTNEEALASKEALEYWLPVDWYNGGMEHTTLHLLYSRFWHKFLYDNGVVPCKEPYQKRTSHGMILGSNGEKMSKSRGNVVNPDEIVEDYGADTLRTYEMFIGAFDLSASWSDDGVKGCRRFLDRVWKLQDIMVEGDTYSADMETKMHQTIKKVSGDFENLKFNTAIAAMMALINDFYKKNAVTKAEYTTLVTLLNPVAPHITEELWQIMGNEGRVYQTAWPQYDEAKTVESTIEIAVQINGKIKATIAVGKDDPADAVIAKAKEELGDKLTGNIVKEIYVPGRIVNIVAK